MPPTIKISRKGRRLRVRHNCIVLGLPFVIGFVISNTLLQRNLSSWYTMERSGIRVVGDGSGDNNSSSSRASLPINATLIKTSDSNDISRRTNNTANDQAPDDTGGLKVLSFSIYGLDRRYLDGLFRTALSAPKVYPGWQVRVYHAPGLHRGFKETLAAIGHHVTLVDVSKELPYWVYNGNGTAGIDPTMWRFLVASDPSVSAYAIRDADSLISPREKSAVDEWLASGKKFHIIHDHPLHHPTLYAAILAGMFGGRRDAVPHMDRLLKGYYDLKKVAGKTASVFGEDQFFLWRHILPLARNDCVHHDSYYCEEGGGVAFPMTRIQAGAPHDFVGDLHLFVGKGGTGQTHADLPDLQKCMLWEKNRARYMNCLRRRQDMIEEARQVGGYDEDNVWQENKKFIPASSYIGPSKKGTKKMDPSVVCARTEDDEFFSFDAPVVRTSTAKDMVQSGNIGVQTPTFEYILWSSDFHISPIANVKNLFNSWSRTKDYTIIDESLSGRCEQHHTCATNLRVLNRANGGDLGRCPNELKREFWREYANDQRMNTVDAFLCQHNPGLCENFMAFDRPMIVIASTRYEVGRTNASAWSRLNDNLRAIASNPRNTIAANNRYDAEYLMHFTGLKGVKVLPSFCAYTNAKYNQTRPEVLIGPGRLSRAGKDLLFGPDGLRKAAAVTKALNLTRINWPASFLPIREFYGKYNYTDLAAHPAIVLIPYQVSVMSVFEYYRMGIPLFAPSLELLVKWQSERLLMKELTWNCIAHACDEKSSINGHPNSPHGDRDPNDMNNDENLKYWLKFADFYQWPEITLFDSWEDLFEKIENADFDEIHKRMMQFNEAQKEALVRDWSDILDRAFKNTAPRIQSMKDVSATKDNTSWEKAVLKKYPDVAGHTNKVC